MKRFHRISFPPEFEGFFWLKIEHSNVEEIRKHDEEREFCGKKFTFVFSKAIITEMAWWKICRW